MGQRTNEIMKRLTILSAIFLPLAFVVGFFGRNFDTCPSSGTGLHSDRLMWPMVAICLVTPAAMLAWFKHIARSTAMVVTCVVALGAVLTLAGERRYVLPEELKPFVPKGHAALDFAIGDLDGDGRSDAVLILKGPAEVREKDDMEAQRPLLLLIRQPEGRLKQERRTDRLVYCRNCGGMMGDPYMGIVVGKGRFTVSHYGGSAWRWEVDYTFAYDGTEKDWFLDREKTTTFQIFDETRKESTFTREQLGDCPVETFDATGEDDNRKWRVAVVRAYFYDRPDLKSRPRKAYLVTGDLVESWRELRSFIEGEFTNSKGKTSSGFLLKRDLEVMPEQSAR